ncbi:MAG: tetratricopeptide repeat protein, partial [Magnetococcales bacterium]|nr:tetratricopeptide repeat protein [Magnetococcales bacterium]
MDSNKKSTPIKDKLTTHSLDSVYSKAVYHFNTQHYLEAQTLCTTIIQAVPKHIDAINLLGIIAQKLDRHDLAVEQFQRAINIDNSGWLLHYNLGISLNSLGRVEEALQVLIIALQKNPGEERIVSLTHSIIETAILHREFANLQDKVDQFFQHGLSMHQGGHLEEALRWYERVTEIQANNPDALCNAGVILQTQGKLNAAIAKYQQAITVKPDNVDAYSNLATALQEQGRVDQALISCQKAVALKPDFASAHNNLANVLHEQGQYAESITHYQTAVSIDPGFADAYHNLSLNQLLTEDFVNGWENYNWR